MKSKRAIRYLIENKMGATILLYYAEQAAILAEQDPEERAVKAANMLCEDLAPTFLHPMKREWMIDKFKEFYNKGE